MQSDLLAESDRAPGFAAFMQAIFEASLPPSELKKSRSWISTAPRTKRCPTTIDVQPDGDGALCEKIQGRTH